jgi:hypothetical protein
MIYRFSAIAIKVSMTSSQNWKKNPKIHMETQKDSKLAMQPWGKRAMLGASQYSPHDQYSPAISGNLGVMMMERFSTIPDT